MAIGVLMPSLASGEMTTPPGDTVGDPSSFEASALVAAAEAIALVVLRGVVSCSLPKGVEGGLGGDTLMLSGAVRTSSYQASNACMSNAFQALQLLIVTTEAQHVAWESNTCKARRRLFT